MIQPPSRTPDETDFVLIVDDDDILSRSLDRVLSREGYGTMLARDGKAALDILQRGGIVPSVILVDLMMPRMGGLALVERLERDATFCSIPVILMSGHVALARGNNVRDLQFLPKPFRPDDILLLVRHVARRTSSRWARPGSNANRGANVEASASSEHHAGGVAAR